MKSSYCMIFCLLLTGCMDRGAEEQPPIHMSFNSYGVFEIDSIAVYWKEDKTSKGTITFTTDSVFIEEEDSDEQDKQLVIDTFFGTEDYSKFTCIDKDSSYYEIGVVPVREDSSRYVVNVHKNNDIRLLSFRAQLLNGG